MKGKIISIDYDVPKNIIDYKKARKIKTKNNFAIDLYDFTIGTLKDYNLGCYDYVQKFTLLDHMIEYHLENLVRNEKIFNFNRTIKLIDNRKCGFERNYIYKIFIDNRKYFEFCIKYCFETNKFFLDDLDYDQIKLLKNLSKL